MFGDWRSFGASPATWVFGLVILLALVCAQTSHAQPAPAPDLATNPPARGPRLNPALPTIFIAGDSTAARSSATNQPGGAAPFGDYFNPTKVNIINRARGGRSRRTFSTEGLWDQLPADVKTNDLVLIQFGHHDAGAINDASRARGSIRCLGEETEEIDNLVTKKHEMIHTFGWFSANLLKIPDQTNDTALPYDQFYRRPAGLAPDGSAAKAPESTRQHKPLPARQRTPGTQSYARPGNVGCGEPISEGATQLTETLTT